ncbi:hypothetical protein V7T16_04610 [Vibrio metoecus]|uniref:Uncharacterized protein n=1 Tax=Vibrio metoecus TaxID=1481663 RepID=A0A271VX24_VIBMT|nr:hypothetical protein [Vibrio metoecus]EEX66451.1 hypothetical protein VCJ_001130 [Vibrio metoecus]KQA22115.1 hypothetical protein AAY54_02405 [Vibrio metoecus]KQA28002.1 hypothetical protein AAY53_01895 [Vibrio metoecus]KQB10101.1 hypothetical protein XV94_03360 [Vibrio metoecus]PAR22145.1 hypothetical protein CGU03_03995 [Vibrio metoecus]
MPIEYKNRVAYLVDHVGVEEAETLLTWMESTPGSSVNLKHCKHVHSAVLQALMYEKPRVTVLPNDPELKQWLSAANIIGKGESSHV